MEKVLMYFDESKYENSKSIIEDVQKEIQKIIDMYEDLELGAITPKELFSLIFETEHFLQEKTLASVQLTVSGIKVSGDKFYELMEKPEAYSYLVEMTEKLTKSFEWRIQYWDGFSVYNYLDLFELVEGKISIKASTLAELKDKSSLFAVKNQTKVLFEVAKKLADVINESELFKKVPHTKGYDDSIMIDRFFKEVIEVNYSEKQAIIKLDGIKRYDSLREMD